MTLNICTDLRFPIDFITARVALVGMSGAGKSNAFTVMVEEVHSAGGLFIFVDPLGASWGLRSSADGEGPGIAVPIFGGYHADVDIKPGAGRILARELYHGDLSGIVDLSAFEDPKDGPQFIADLAREFMKLHRRQKKPRAFFVDEAQSLFPERMSSGESDECRAAGMILHTQGRGLGIGLKTATQSSAEQDKRTMKQAELFVALRTFSPLDQKPVLEYARTAVEKEKADEIRRSLAKLPNGTAWFISPQWLGTVEQSRFRYRTTYDSSKTPTLGEMVATPQASAPIDLERLHDVLSTADNADLAIADPKELRKRIADLERKLANAPQEEYADLVASVAHARVLADVEKRNRMAALVVVEQLRELLTVARARAGAIVHDLETIPAYQPVADIMEATTEFLDQHPNFHEELASEPNNRITTRYSTEDGGSVDVETRVVDAFSLEPHNRADTTDGQHAATEPEAASIPAQRTSRPTEGSNESGTLSKVQRAILTALAQAAGCDLDQLAILAGYKQTGAFHGALADLRTRGLVNRGRPIAITPDGLAVLGPYEKLPTGKKLREYWLGQLATNERGILKQLIDAHPSSLSLQVISHRTGYKITGSFHSAIAKLRKLKLVEGPGSGLLAAKTLYQ